MERKGYTEVLGTLDLLILRQIKPLEDRKTGSFASPTFNAYYDLPEAVRPAVLSGLDNMVEHFLLTRAEVARGMRRNQFDDYVNEVAYAKIADDFAALFYPGFSSQRLEVDQGIDDRVWQLRRIFFQMIRLNNVLKVRKAVGVIVAQMGFNPKDKEQVMAVLNDFVSNRTVCNAILERVEAAHGGRSPHWWRELFASVS